MGGVMAGRTGIFAGTRQGRVKEQSLAEFGESFHLLAHLRARGHWRAGTGTFRYGMTGHSGSAGRRHNAKNDRPALCACVSNRLND